MTSTAPIRRTYKVAHLFCGLGAGAKGFNRGHARVGVMEAGFECLGGIDVDPAAIRDFSRLAGVPGTLLDLFSRAQFVAFHGREPGPDWREATVDDVRRAFRNERPNVVFLSAPCKGFSGLLSETASKTAKYQALNGLTLRGVWLTLEAYRDDPPELVVFENVPRIASRGRALLDQIVALLRAYGYAVAETVHDCGRIGGLGQTRKRFLLVARHARKVPNFLYEPVTRPLRSVGDVLERFPLPGDPRGGPMHRMPSLQWKTWVRLAFVEAGADWRSLNRLKVEGGVLADYGIEPHTGWQAGVLGVRGWDQTSGTVTSRALPGNGAFAIADPRVDGHAKSVQLGVRPWTRPAGVVTSKMIAGGGPHSVADPRIEGARFNTMFRIVDWRAPSPAVAGPGGPGNGLSVADPRPSDRPDYKQTKYRVTRHDEPAGTVIAASTTGNGAFAVADPRPAGLNREGREGYASQGHYGVTPWTAASGAVPAYAKYDRGSWAVADPREPEPQDLAALPRPEDRLVAVIQALDGTWHRPFTTLELAALQGLVEPDEHLELDGLSDSAWRERIGNAVPPPAAEAIAGVMGRTLLLAEMGETFTLSSEPIWVRPVAAGLMAAAAGLEASF